MNYFLRINFKQFHKKIQYFVNVNGVYSVLKSGGKMHNLISPKKEKKNYNHNTKNKQNDEHEYFQHLKGHKFFDKFSNIYCIAKANTVTVFQ